MSKAKKNEADSEPIIPKHITINFSEEADKLAFIREQLKQRNFDPQKDRTLVFVLRRADAEKYAAAFVDYKSDYYHAARSSEEKKEVAAQYKEGKIAVMFSTKAFGMGVDIPNIRFVFHTTPPASLEDYVQEIGRAGRDTKAAHAFLPYTNDDFKEVRSRILRSNLHWGMVKTMHTVVKNYQQTLALGEQASFVVPADLILSEPSLREKLRREAAPTRQRMLLHSLEEARRLVVGDFELTHWPVRLGNVVSNDPKVGKIRDLAAHKGATETVSVLISERELQADLALPSDEDAREQLFYAAKLGAISIPFEVIVDWAKPVKNEQNPVNPEDLITRAEKLFSPLAKGNSWKFKHNDIHPDYLNEEQQRKQRRETNPSEVYFDERKPRLLRFLRRITGLRLTNDKTALVYTASAMDKEPKHNEPAWRDVIKNLTKRAGNLVKYLREVESRRQNENEAAVTIDALYKAADPLLNKMRFKDLELVLNYLAALGIVYLKNDLVPVSVRLEITERFASPFETKEDEAACEQLNERNQMRLWRLNALHVLTRMPGKDAQNAFAKGYFTAASLTEVIGFVSNEAGKVDEELAKELRGAALRGFYDELTAEQQNVVRAAQTQNTLVEAGPGTGKTHTLVICVAQRLIASDQIEARNAEGPTAASNLLILAYTRAVVEEVRQRIDKLLLSSGRKEKILVETFHSYAMRKLSQKGITNLSVKEVVAMFNKVFTKEKLHDAPGHIFVDEFQDITPDRARMLKILSKNGHSPLLMVIGDPCQSIFEYDQNQQDERPDWFSRFANGFHAKPLYLTENFRSDRLILQEAESLFERRLRLHQSGETGSEKEGKVEILSANDINLSDCVKQAVEASSQSAQTAVLFRTNAELYENLSALKQVAVNCGANLSILGSKANIAYSREVNETLEALSRSHAGQPFSAELVANVQQSISTQGIQCWDYRLLQGVIYAAQLYEQEAQNGHGALTDDFISWVRGDKSVSSPLYSFGQKNKEAKKGLVVSTIHRSKGLEFDTVVLAKSDMPFTVESSDEEKRLRYVAITRARHHLILINGSREIALLSDEVWSGSDVVRGRRFETIDKEDNVGAFNLSGFSDRQSYILNEIREGDALDIKKNQLWHNNISLCWITMDRKDLREQSLTGIFVSEIVRRDGFGENDKHKDKYSPQAQQAGWSYIVNAAGYLRPMK